MLELTVQDVCDRLGCEVKIVKEHKYIFQAGDVAKSGCLRGVAGRRFIISVGGKLASVNRFGSIQGYGQKYFESNNYKFVDSSVPGNI